jgi:tol-pal system protein YbgF
MRMALAHPRMVRILQLLVLCGTLAQGAAHAGLFDDDEARKAILELRQRVEAGRQATEASLQRLQAMIEAQRAAITDALRDSQTQQLQRNTEENTQLRRSLLELQNQIESLRAEITRLQGRHEEALRTVADLQRSQKDLAAGQKDLAAGQKDLAAVQQDLARGVDERVRQLEPVKVSVDGRDILVEPAERRVYESALASFRASDFPAAQSGFQTLIARYPKTGYLPSALFWLGNAQYATRDYKEAITNFRILLQAAPDHLRAPEALLSIANCQIELKDTRGARKSLEDLGKAYPQSEAAQAAKERLARLR